MNTLSNEQLEYIFETSDIDSKRETINLLHQIINIAPDKIGDIIDIRYIANLKDGPFYQLFEYCMLACRLNELDEHIRALIKLFTLEIEKSLNVIHVITAFTKYMSRTNANEELIEYVFARNIQDVVDTWKQLANWVEFPNIQIPMDRLIKLGNVSSDDLMEIIQIANNYTNYTFKEHLLSHLHQNMPAIDKPTYVKDLGLKNAVLSDIVNKIQKPKLSELELVAADDLTVPLEQIDIDEYAFMISQQMDIDLMKILGPVNYNPQSTDPNCSYYGGCRYLLCTCHENVIYEDYRESDWFYGYCTNCGFRIPNRQSAVRETILGGGYKGCFCSIKCMTIQLYNFENQDTYSFDDLHPLNPEGYERQSIVNTITPAIYEKISFLSDEELYYFSMLPLVKQILVSATIYNLYTAELQDDYIIEKVQMNEIEPAADDVYISLIAGYKERNI